MARLDGKTALVTGSTQGLGEAIAHRFAGDGAAGIAVCGRNVERGDQVAAALVEMGTEAIFIPVELGDPDSVARLIAETDKRFGRIDVLVNSAGLTVRGSIEDTTPDLFDMFMAVNVRAPFLLMQGAIEIMRREGVAGTIVNIGSVASHGSMPYLAPYAASKAALVALTKNVAYAVMWDRIRVNTLNLGWMDTPGEDAIQRRFHSEGRDWLEEAEAAQPFGRLLKTDEVAAAVAFLASDESGMMTGANIDFDQSVIGAGPQPIPPRPE